MEYDRGGSYLKEIDHVSILESIDEVFDGATSLMTLNSVMYGSSVTSIIAGQPIVGDLDIAASNQEYMKLCQNFSSSVKWVQVDGRSVPERRVSLPRGDNKFVIPSSSSPPSKQFKDPYKGAKHLPISSVVAFRTVNGACVQIVESKAMTGDMLEDALEVVRKVDFTFCGMALDMYGRMLETIPHAYSDCCNRIIRIKEYQPRLDAKHLKYRLHKYIKRGWHLSMSIDQAVLNLKKAQIEYAKKKKKSPRKPGAIKDAPGFKIKPSVGKGPIIVVSRDLINMIGSKGKVRDVVKHFALSEHGIDLATNSDTRHGGMELWSSKKKSMSVAKARKITDQAFSHLRRNYSIDVERLNYGIKQKKAEQLYQKKELRGLDSSYYGSTSSTTTWGSR